MLCSYYLIRWFFKFIQFCYFIIYKYILKVNSLVKKLLIDIYEINMGIVDGIWNFVFILYKIKKKIIFGSYFYVNKKNQWKLLSDKNVLIFIIMV